MTLSAVAININRAVNDRITLLFLSFTLHRIGCHLPITKEQSSLLKTQPDRSIQTEIMQAKIIQAKTIQAKQYRQNNTGKSILAKQYRHTGPGKRKYKK